MSYVEKVQNNNKDKNKALDLIVPIETVTQLNAYKKQKAIFPFLNKNLPNEIEKIIHLLKIMFGGKEFEYRQFIYEFTNLGLIIKGQNYDSSINLDNDKVNAYLEKLSNSILEYEKTHRMGFGNETMS